MYLRPAQRAFSLTPSAASPCLLALLPPAHRMHVLTILRHVCAALPFPRRLFVSCLLLDTLYLACVYDTASLPASSKEGNGSQLLNKTADLSLGPLTSQLMLASQVAAPPASLLPSSSSSSPSRLMDDSPGDNVSFNQTDLIFSQSDSTDNASRGGAQSQAEGNEGNNKQAVSSPRAGKPRKEFPLALVVASATAAVSILLFFCLSYLWHTRQLDRRAQKLAIRLAAEADVDLKCTQCRSVPTYRAGSAQDSGSDSGEECRVLPVLPTVLDQVNSLHEEDEEEAVAEDGSRRKAGGVGRTLGTKKGSRGRGARRSGSRSSRKWSGHSSGQTRSSLVTDQEILNHFASRRHSTFFI